MKKKTFRKEKKNVPERKKKRSNEPEQNAKQPELVAKRCSVMKTKTFHNNGTNLPNAPEQNANSNLSGEFGFPLISTIS